MNKKILSLIVILCTVICVSIMIYFNKINADQNFKDDKVQVLNEKKVNNKEQCNSSNLQAKDKLQNNKETTVTENYKKDKISAVENSIDEDKKDFFSQDNIEENNIDSKHQSNNKESLTNKDDCDTNAKDTSVFKISKSQIKDSLTILDKEKLLSVASKLSAVDYEKIKGYLEEGSNDDIKNTIKLLKQRLSDKDYEKVREVAEKFINMEAIN